MSQTARPSTVTRAVRWFDPRGRTINTIAFILNRITGLGLTLYLFLHLYMLGKLAQGPQAYDQFIATVKNPVFLAGEILVIIAGFLHGLNGIRIALISFGVGVRAQKQMLIVLMIIALAVSAYFAVHMFSA
ncbi:MAG: succinate dehydrogenase, cytochrome b556 subunit [Chloroflexi bacterium]|jgi:succinate dehydrogenase / fumarate reductase cytochrome b subunit|nr:succinate dehydrogenase, cytochrome b556 subunit [Anaerolineaceae bacterium]NMB87843.1 succinate dehydrogenase, cytochrome b556 subunit [Chloroflexota bacterium]